jgi:hypothetical protein
MRQQRHCVLFKPVGEEQRHTARSQYRHHLMDHALGHRQCAGTHTDGQQQLGDRIDGHPYPVRGARQALDGLGLTDLSGLDGTEDGKKFIQLYLREVQVTQEIA